MVIFSHRCKGFAKRENSLEACTAAVNKGFSIEIDLRLKKNTIILSHGFPVNQSRISAGRFRVSLYGRTLQKKKPRLSQRDTPCGVPLSRGASLNEKYIEDDFLGLLSLIKENPSIYFALHIKENSQDLFKRVNDAVERFTNCFIFVTDFPQHDLISKNSIGCAFKNSL